MSKNVVRISTLFIILTSVFFMLGCEKQLTSSAEVSLQQGIPTDQIRWIGWKPEVDRNFAVLSKKGHDGKMITPEKGGVVGSGKTFGNKVEIPVGAVNQNTFITVDIVRTEQGGAAVEFLPSMTFNKDVRITMSFASVNLSAKDVQEGNFKIYYSQDNVTWYPLDPSLIEVNLNDETVSFNINHFTRYGWGF